MHEAKLAKMEAEMKMVFQQKVQEKEAKLKQSEEELYARHREMKEALEKQRLDLDDKKRRIESGRPLTPEKPNVSFLAGMHDVTLTLGSTADGQERIPAHVVSPPFWFPTICRYDLPWLVLVLFTVSSCYRTPRTTSVIFC